MPTFRNIDLEEPSTVTAEAAAVSIDRNSSAELQEILCVGDPDVAAGIARVTQAAPDSTMGGLGVRIISGPSSLADFPVRVIFPSTATNNPVSLPSTQQIRVFNSTATDLLTALPSTQQVRVFNSTAGDLLATVSPASTVWAVQVDGVVRAQNSTIGDFLASVQQNSTVWQVQLPSSQSFQAKNSTIGDFLASVQQNSTVWQVQQSTSPAPPKASTVGRASITQSSTEVALQSSNNARMGWSVFNNPNNGAALYVAFGGGAASTTDFDVRVPPGGLYEMAEPIFFGAIRGVWDSTGAGFARVCERRP